MSLVRPFAALRPRGDLAARIAAVPYDVVNTAEARGLAADPLSFLHVSRAEIDLPTGTDPYDDAVYARAVQAFSELRQSGLEQESRPAVYVYRLRMGSHTQTGVAACYSVEEYRRDLVKKHEKTRPDKENDRTRHIIETRAQSGPVLLTYRRAAAVDVEVARIVTSEPLYDFAAADGITHTIWRAEPAPAEAIIKAFGGVSALYIADGHHRAASAARADEHVATARAHAAGHLAGPSAGEAPVREAAWFLGVAFPDAEMQILPYHRVVKDLAGRTPEAFLDELRARVRVAPGGPPGGPETSRKGQCAMYLAGAWYTLTLDTYTLVDPVASLDVQRLQDSILGPLLAIGDPRTDKRIDFVGGIRGPGELVRLVDSGAAAVAFAMHPTTVDELMAIADAGGIMPPKSTWFEPKLRDGLLTHVI